MSVVGGAWLGCAVLCFAVGWVGVGWGGLGWVGLGWGGVGSGVGGGLVEAGAWAGGVGVRIRKPLRRPFVGVSSKCGGQLWFPLETNCKKGTVPQKRERAQMA